MKNKQERSRGGFWGHWCVLDGDCLIAMEIKFLLLSVRHDLNLYLGIFTPCDSRCLLQYFPFSRMRSLEVIDRLKIMSFLLSIFPRNFILIIPVPLGSSEKIIIAWENTKYSHVLIYSPTSLQKLTVEFTQWTPPKLVCVPIKRKETREPGSRERGRTVLLSTSNSRTSSLCINVRCYIQSRQLGSSTNWHPDKKRANYILLADQSKGKQPNGDAQRPKSPAM